MLSKDERALLRRNTYFMTKEMENQYDILTSFYPAQNLTVTLGEEDIMNIRDCDYSQAKELLKTLRKKFGKDNFWNVRTFDFCDHLYRQDDNR